MQSNEKRIDDIIVMMKVEKQLIDPTTAWLLFLFLGWSYGNFKQYKKQVLFYLTMGGLGVWTLYLLFNFNKKIKEYNNQIYIENGLLDQVK